MRTIEVGVVWLWFGGGCVFALICAWPFFLSISLSCIGSISPVTPTINTLIASFHLFSFNLDQRVSVSNILDQQKVNTRNPENRSHISESSIMLPALGFTLDFHKFPERHIFNRPLGYKGWTGCPLVLMVQQMRWNICCTTRVCADRVQRSLV